MDPTKRHYLEAMGIPVYVRRDAAPEPIPDAREGPRGSDATRRESVEPPTSEPGAVADPTIAAMDWDELRSTVAGCTKCPLCETRTQTVFGVGDVRARWMIVGEAPGADEDRQGEPFVGRAGRLLNSMLEAAGMPRATVYIANILKCRPPGNRDPQPAEAAACRDYLERQIDLVRPELIIAVGRIAAQNLLRTDTPIGKLRGHVHSLGEAGVPVVATYHPAYLLRSPNQKRRAWEDLKLARSVTHGGA